MAREHNGKTVLYLPSIDETNQLHDMGLNSPEIGEDWGLVSEIDSGVMIEFIYSEETVTFPLEQYNAITEETNNNEFVVNNGTRDVLKIGSDATLDLKHREFDIDWLANTLPKSVASVFVAQYEQNERDWPRKQDS